MSKTESGSGWIIPLAILGAAVALVVAAIVLQPNQKPQSRSDAPDAPVQTAQSISETDSRIIGASITDRTIDLIVPSNGCTDKESFSPLVLPEGDGYSVIFRRKRPDLCRAYLPDGTDLTYSLEELGIAQGAEVQVMNPRRN